MSEPLLNDTLIKSVGCSVKDNRGEFIGKVTEVTKDASGNHIEYIILKSKVCFGRGERFFAIPASTTHVEITDDGNMLLHISKDEVQFAQGIAANKCPKPNLKFGHSFFELYNYKVPGQKNMVTLHDAGSQRKIKTKIFKISSFISNKNHQQVKNKK